MGELKECRKKLFEIEIENCLLRKCGEDAIKEKEFYKKLYVKLLLKYLDKGVDH